MHAPAGVGASAFRGKHCCKPSAGNYNPLRNPPFAGGWTGTTVKALRITSAVLLGVCLIRTWGCTPSNDDLYVALQAEDPNVRLKAIHRAGQIKDEAAVPFLVDRLTDSQEVVRFFAILALERITGSTMDWNYYDPPVERAGAVDRWRAWLESGRKQAPETQEGMPRS